MKRFHIHALAFGCVWFLVITVVGIGMLTNTTHVNASKQQLDSTVTSAYPPPIIEDDDFSQINSEEDAYPAPGATQPPIVLTNLAYRIRLPIVMKRNYNRDAAVAYADQWAKDRNPAFPNYGTDWDCTDCTNYLSQMLFAGGHSLIARYGDTVFDWWYFCDEYSICNNSNTWSATDWMNSYAHQYADRFEVNPQGIDLSAGDFYILKLPTSPDPDIPNHARLVVGWGYPEEGDNLDVWSLLVNQHCTDRKRVRWNYNFPEGTVWWRIHVLD